MLTTEEYRKIMNSQNISVAEKRLIATGKYSVVSRTNNGVKIDFHRDYNLHGYTAI